MKNLPIQLVEFRGPQDEFIHEPRGNNDLPTWIKRDDEICYTNSARVHEQLHSWLPLFDEREQQHNAMPLLFEVAIHEKAEAKSYRKDIYSVLNFENSRNVLGMTDRRRLLVKVNNRSDLQRMSRRFAARRGDSISKQKLTAYASIEDTTLFRSTVDSYEEGEELKVKLVNFQDEHYNDACARNLRNLCAEYGQICEKLDYVDGLILYKTRAVSHEFVERLASMDGMLYVGGMPSYTLDVSDLANMGEVPCERPEEGKIYPVVGLLDTGVADIEPMQPWMNGQSHVPEEWANIAVKSHGTMVASVLLYGDKLCNETRTGTSPCLIRDNVVSVMDAGLPLAEDKLVAYIKQAIAANPDVKIWNCSMGSETEAPLNNISDFGKTLDSLQLKNDIVICKSAGNKKGEFNRITQGADSLLSLVVGSTAYEQDLEGNEVENWSPSSCVGLSAGEVIKPDLANLGGDNGDKIKLINEFGGIIQSYGTSFATPRITAMAGAIAQQLGENYNPLLVKALLIHGSSYPISMQEEEWDEKIKKVGFGVPEPIAEIMQNDENEITMIFLCQLHKGRDFRAIQFVYPEGLVEDGHYYGDITITVVTKPILNNGQAVEICQTNVNVELDTYESTSRNNFSNPDIPRWKKNQIDLVGNKNILVDSLYSKSRRRSSTSELFESNQIEKHHKYSPVKKFHVNLEQMKPKGRLDYLSASRSWALKIIPQFRVDLPETVGNEDLTIDVCLVMTIRDPKEKGVVYDQAINQLDDLNFVHSNLVIREDVDVESGEE